MKTLIIGTGVIGSTYGWQLHEAGYDITHYVKKTKKEDLIRTGLVINCMDMRERRTAEITVTYRPAFIDDFSPADGFELIIVPVNTYQVSSLLPLLRERAGNAHILFFQNIWDGIGEIENYLNPEQYLFGYPFKAGGGRNGNEIQSIIFGEALSATMIGETDGRITSRLKNISAMMRRARMKPRITKKIIPYLKTHYVWAGASLGAYMKAGSWDRFTTDGQCIRESYLAMREGFEICKKMGINPGTVSPSCLFYLPLFLLVPYTMHAYNTEGMRKMFEGHVAHSPEEMRVIYHDILEAGKREGIDMPVYRGFSKYVNEYLASLKETI
ncbi:MAG: ketopantoate reductase family protein [Spirochaetae bacterium HGW-Spirochaetae-1]|jgi:2-dehydropantoate 2-reductase|nr:MAG: ketopantoate reductase family protein [Spirochaetae bacterium HGW-Spirochaetae-1]